MLQVREHLLYKGTNEKHSMFIQHNPCENSVVVNQLQILWEKDDKHESTYLSMFEHDTTFDMKFTHHIDRCLQMLISNFSYESY